MTLCPASCRDSSHAARIGRLVREHADPADRRKKRLKLTDSGRLLLAEAERLSTGSSQQLLASLGAEKATLLLSLLEQFSAAAKTEVAD